VEELRDEYVYLEHIGDILLLHVAQDVDEPLKVLVRWADPQEVHLLAGHARVSVGTGAKDQIVENGGVRGDPDAAADHHGHLELVPVLVAASKWSLDAYFGLILRIVVAGIEVIAQLPRPRTLGLDVATQAVLVRCRGQRKAVHLMWPEGCAGQPHPLTRKVL